MYLIKLKIIFNIISVVLYKIINNNKFSRLVDFSCDQWRKVPQLHDIPQAPGEFRLQSLTNMAFLRPRHLLGTGGSLPVIGNERD